MYFDLSPELIDQLIFAMENQAERLVFDTEEKKVVTVGELPAEYDESRYVDIPEWNSTKGFQLMEQFVAGLRNQEYREALRAALSRGKGVFRQFKDIIKQNEQVERLWFSFKEKELKREVKEWYAALRELWGCENLDLDLEFIEETEDIIIEDFVFDSAVYDIGYDTLAEYDKRGFYEALKEYDSRWVDYLYSRRKERLPELEGPRSLFFVARSPAGDFTAFIWAVHRADGDISIEQLYVLPEYRGLGLAKTMLTAFIEELADGDCRNLTMHLCGVALSLGDFIQQQGFSLFSKDFVMDLKNR